MKNNIISFNELVASLPEKEKVDKKELWDIYWYVRKMMKRYSEGYTNVLNILTDFHKAGNQFIADFNVSDLERSVKNEYNWHLQNTSQWLFAGCILVEGGIISIHT